MLKVLFVCLGNICRSPLAEGLFIEAVEKRGLSHLISTDSAGTNSYHIGELADKRTRANALSHGLELTHRARQFKQADFGNFDLILAMDNNNYHDILRVGEPKQEKQVQLMREFDPNATDLNVPDPYYGDAKDFEEVYQILRRSTENFLDALVRQYNL